MLVRPAVAWQRGLRTRSTSGLPCVGRTIQAGSAGAAKPHPATDTHATVPDPHTSHTLGPTPHVSQASDDESLTTVFETESSGTVAEELADADQEHTSSDAALHAAPRTRPAAPLTITKVNPDTATATAVTAVGMQGARAAQLHVAPAPTLAALSMSPSPLPPGMHATVHGWVVAFSLLLAVRLSRDGAAAERLDTQALQARQAESRVQGAELRELRRAYLEQETARKEAEAARRVEEGRRRAEQEAVERARQEAAYREAAAQETARLWAEQQAARQAFLEAEGRMSAELAARTAREVELREQELARRTALEAQLQAQRAAARAAAAAEAAQRVAEEEKMRQQAAAARLAERERIRAAQTRFVISVHGRVTVQQPPLGTLITDSSQAGWQGVPQLARLQLALQFFVAGARQLPPTDGGTAGTSSADATSTTSSTQPSDSSSTGSARSALSALNNAAWQRLGLPHAQALPSVPWALGGACAGSSTALCESAAAVIDSATPISGEAGAQLLECLFSDMQLATPSTSDSSSTVSTSDSSMSGAGSSQLASPAEAMDSLELLHWHRVCAAGLEVCSRQATAQVASLADQQALQQPFEAVLYRGVLPAGHPARVDTRLIAAVAAVARQQLQECVELVASVVEDEEEWSAAACVADGSTWLSNTSAPGSNPSVALPALTLTTLVYAHLLDRASVTATTSVSVTDANSASDTSTSDSSQTEGSSQTVHNQVLQLAMYQLGQAAKRCLPDELGLTARCVRAALGANHPLAAVLARLADENMSTATRMRLQARRHQQELDVAAALVRAQSPDAAPLDPSSAGARKALVPVPERLWATRNVATSMARYGDTSKASEAVAMLKEACELAASHYGSEHPTCLGVLLDTRDTIKVVLSGRERAADTDLQQQQGGLQQQEDVRGLQQDLCNVTSAAVQCVEALAQRYSQAGDMLSVVILYEAAVKELGPLEQASPPQLLHMQQTASSMLYELSPAESRIVMGKRKAVKSLLRVLAREFTEELQVYSMASRKTRREQWVQGLPLTSLRDL